MFHLKIDQGSLRVASGGNLPWLSPAPVLTVCEAVGTYMGSVGLNRMGREQHLASRVTEE